MNTCGEVVSSQLVIVDNGSGDQSASTIAAWMKDVNDDRLTFIANSRNLGFSVGMNKGIAAAANKENFDFYWLLNNDLIVEPGSLSALSGSIHQKPDVAIWGSTVLDDTSLKVQCAGGCQYNRWIGMERAALRGTTKAEVADAEPPAFDYIYGAAILIRADVLTRQQGLNEDYFLYFEELDLAQRLQPGENLGWCRGSVVLHLGGGSFSNKSSKSFAAFHAALSAFKFTWKYYPVCLPSVVMARVIGLTIFSFRYLNPELALAPWKAIWAFVQPKAR
jgi:GT2 family glycosyltransferase